MVWDSYKTFLSFPPAPASPGPLLPTFTAAVPGLVHRALLRGVAAGGQEVDHGVARVLWTTRPWRPWRPWRVAGRDWGVR